MHTHQKNVNIYMDCRQRFPHVDCIDLMEVVSLSLVLYREVGGNGFTLMTIYFYWDIFTAFIRVMSLYFTLPSISSVIQGKSVTALV